MVTWVSRVYTQRRLHDFLMVQLFYNSCAQIHPVVYWGVYAGIRRIPTSGFFWQRILTSAVINKHGTFRPFATPVCVYPPPFLAIHHWIHPSYSPGGTTVHRHVTHFLAQACILAPPGEYDWMYWMYLQLNSCLQTEYSSNSTTLNANTSSMIKYYNGYLISRNITQVGDIKCYF